MTRTLLAATIALPPVSSALAQDPLSRFLDGMFKQERQAPAPAPQPPASRPQATPSAPGAPPAPPLRSGAPARAPAPLAPPLSGAGAALPTAQPAPAGAQPLPPRRPAGIGGAGSPQPLSPSPSPAPVAAPAQAPAQQGAVPRNASEAVARVNAYLNGISTLTARFVQVGADRRQVGGTLFVQRPGRLRFAYDPPSTLEIVADGRSVAVRDSKLRTNDVYSIGQTPLKFLLRDNVDLARDVKVRNVDIDPGGLVGITMEDSATLGGTSRVTLHFDARANVLRGWLIVDPQGYETEVSLSGVEVARR